jgi:anti-sigma-K factor RskA
VHEPDIHDRVAPYALGALDGAERRSFADHLLGCGRCRGELPGLQEAAAALALDVDAPEPPIALRGRIVGAARNERLQDEEVAPRARGRWVVPAAAGFAAAAACAAIGLGIWSVTLSRDLDRERSARRVDDRAVGVLADPTAVHYALVGARGQVVVTRTRDAALVVSELRRAPAGTTYELWVVIAQETQPAGLFAGGGSRSLVALTRKVPHGARVGVSLEPAGGSTRRTGSLLFGAQTT